MSHIKVLGIFYIAFFVFYIFFVLPLPVVAATTAIKITDPIASRFTWPPGEVFVDTVNQVNYQSGKMILSSTPDGTGDIYVDDAIDIIVNQGNQIGRGESIVFENNCADPHQQLPKDVTKYFYNGDNIVHIKLHDICGGYVGSFALYLVNITDSSSVPSPTPKPSKTPLIFIPGMAGSELKVKNDTNLSIDNGHGGTLNKDYKAGEKIWVNEFQAGLPGEDDYFDILKLKNDGLTSEADLELTGDIFAGSYSATIKFFTDNGYTLNKDFFVFPYDWRKDVANDISLLDQKINQIKLQEGVLKVDIVAHSMGGLVVRNYISDSVKAGNIGKFISLGTPYLGTSHTLKALMYGDCLTKKDFSGFKDFLCLGISKSEVKDVLQNSSGAYELLPTLAYYNFYNGSDASHPTPFKDDRDIDSNGVTGSLIYDQTKTLLANLKYNSGLYSFNESLHSNDNQNFNTNNVDTTFIVGSGQPTDGQIVEGNLINLGGLKLIPHKDILTINGDDTTPIFSGSLTDSAKNLNLNGFAKVYFAKLKHEELPANNLTLSFIKNILEDNNQIPNGILTIPYLLNGTQVSVHSPVNIDVYDAQGEHTGLDSNGDVEENIPGSIYETLDDAKFIWLPDDGKYTVKFTATDEGSFTYKIRTFNNDQNTKTVLFKDVPLTNITIGEENLDTTASEPEPLKMDENGDGIVDLNINSSVNIPGSEYNDSTPPEAKITYNPMTQDIEIMGTDNISNVLVTDLGDGKFSLRDDNGNTTTLLTDSKDKKKRDKIQLQSIAYNQSAPSSQSDNRFVVVHKLNKDSSVQQFNQRIIIKGDEKLVAIYDPKTNKTRIVTKENGKEKKTEFKNGVVLVYLVSRNGSLGIAY